jgi:NAD(P)-dependent dehydrogenase (short-subunit alcohol dehydrogenase family)
MTTNKVWLITGAGRGIGVDIAKAALAVGHKASALRFLLVGGVR